LRYYYHYNIATIQYCNKCKIAMITTYPWLKCCHYLLQYCHDCNVLIIINSTLSKVVSKKKPFRIEPRLQTPPLFIKVSHCPIICMPHCWIGLLVSNPTVILSQCPIITVSPWSYCPIVSTCYWPPVPLPYSSIVPMSNFTYIALVLLSHSFIVWLPYFSVSSVPLSKCPTFPIFHDTIN